MTKTKKLTFWESVMLIAGAGIGTGIITIPYAISKIGIFGTAIALAPAYVISILTYLILADLVRNSTNSEDLIGALNEHLFRGKGKKALSIIFFVLLAMLLLEFLVVYSLCAGDVISDLFGISRTLSIVIFYILASLIVFFGVKGMGVGEKISVLLIGAVVIVLTVLSFFHQNGTFGLNIGKPGTVFAVYGLFMYSMSSTFAVIQVCNHIEKPEKTGKAVVTGTAVNAAITVVFSIAVILGSKTVTETATIGLSDGIGIPFVKVLCSVLVIGAMFTSFWSIGFAFSDVVSSQFKLDKRLSWLITTIPAVLTAILLPLSILNYVQIGAGALSIIFLIVVFPAYKHALDNPINPPLLGKISGKWPLILIVVIGTILMAISSFVPVT